MRTLSTTKIVLITVVVNLVWLIVLSLILPNAPTPSYRSLMHWAAIALPIASITFMLLYLYRRWEDSRRPLPEPLLHPLPHALKAARKRDKSLLDIGFIGFWGQEGRGIYQTRPIPTSIEALQPYIQIRWTQYSEYRVDFEIINDRGARVFFQSIHKWVEQGNHFTMPKARLRLDTVPTGKWKLRVYVNKDLIAHHRFGWIEDTVQQVEGNLRADGEVQEELLSLLTDDYSERMSLDELLSESDHKNNETTHNLDT